MGEGVNRSGELELIKMGFCVCCFVFVDVIRIHVALFCWTVHVLQFYVSAVYYSKGQAWLMWTLLKVVFSEGG